MKTITYTTQKTINQLEITHDDLCESPRNWSNLGYFITIDRNYRSPDNNQDIINIVKDTGDNATSQEEHMNMIKKDMKDQLNEEVISIYPIVKYEHSGVVYRLGTQHGFDYSNNGFYIITKKQQEEYNTPKKDFETIINQELKTYNQYINGEVYQFTLYNEQGEIVDSCGGFYDLEDIKDHLPEEWKDEDLTDYLTY
jgi:hypothetical protein